MEKRQTVCRIHTPPTSLSHALLGHSLSGSLEFAETAEVYMATATYSDLKVVVRIAPFSKSATGVDFLATLLALVERFSPMIFLLKAYASTLPLTL